MGMTRDKMEFAFLMAKCTNAVLGDVLELLRYGAAHKTIQERTCNGYSSSEEEHKDQHKEKRIRERITRRCRIIDASSVIFGGDPRGATVKICVKNGYTNDWGKQGICVPTS